MRTRVFLECLGVEFLGSSGGQEIGQPARSSESSEYQQRIEKARRS